MDYLSSQEKFLWRRKTMTIFSLTAREKPQNTKNRKDSYAWGGP